METPEQYTDPNAIQIVNHVEIYERGNVLTLFYGGTSEAMYKYPGAIFGLSVSQVRAALSRGDAAQFPNDLNIQRTI